jgi:threonine/homoserine efflux transporter RhtA
MTLHSVILQPIISLIAGVLILIQPSLLSYIVAIYLIIVGVLGLAAQYG